MAQIICPLCHTQSDHGVRVCVGCQATIIYGATENDTKALGSIIAVALFACIVYAFGWPHVLPAIGLFVGCAIAGGLIVGALLKSKISFHRIMVR